MLVICERDLRVPSTGCQDICEWAACDGVALYSMLIERPCGHELAEVLACEACTIRHRREVAAPTPTECKVCGITNSMTIIRVSSL